MHSTISKLQNPISQKHTKQFTKMSTRAPKLMFNKLPSEVADLAPNHEVEALVQKYTEEVCQQFATPLTHPLIKGITQSAICF